MHKFSISIVIPAVGGIHSSPIIRSFLDIDCPNLYVQFVFLLNGKNIPQDRKSDIIKFDRYEIISVVNDRYFGSCEENLYRSADFSDLFCEFVFFIGEHDAIDWSHLVLALDRFQSQNLAVMGWNIRSQQRKTNGDFAEISAIAALNSKSSANEFCHILLNKGILSSSVAYPALISTYGPIDWAAYLGNHLFRKNVFQRVFQFKFSEYVYSLVYKQLLLFSLNDIRYGFYEEFVISRVSDDFLKIKEHRFSLGWLEDHRTVHGLSKCFWVSNLQYLVEIKNPKLFNLVSNSLCLSQRPDSDNEGINYSQSSALSQILNWSTQVVNLKLVGKSHYFSESVLSGSVSDLFTVSEYLKILCFQNRSDRMYNILGKDFSYHLSATVSLLCQYLNVSNTSELLLSRCLVHLDQLSKLPTANDLIEINNMAFNDYLFSLQDLT